MLITWVIADDGRSYVSSYHSSIGVYILAIFIALLGFIKNQKIRKLIFLFLIILGFLIFTPFIKIKYQTQCIQGPCPSINRYTSIFQTTLYKSGLSGVKFVY